MMDVNNLIKNYTVCWKTNRNKTNIHNNRQMDRVRKTRSQIQTKHPFRTPAENAEPFNWAGRHVSTIINNNGSGYQHTQCPIDEHDVVNPIGQLFGGAGTNI
jgi:hypothetical protein